MSDFPKRILHADDDPVIRDIVKKALKDYAKLQYKICENGEQLLEITAEFQPDLILLDLSMPVMDGLDVLHALHVHRQKVKPAVILFTGHKEVQMCAEYEKLGVIGVLHKPISFGVLPERIRFMWVEHQGKEGIPGGGSSGLM